MSNLLGGQLRQFTCILTVLFTCINFNLVSTVRDRSISNSDGSCHDASQLFKSKGIGDALKIPLSQVNGEQLSICKSKKSCCSPEIEGKLKKKVNKEFTDIMQAATSHIKNVIGTDTAKFQESFIDMVRLSENNTQALFAGVYESMVATTRLPIKRLYSSLVSYIHGRSGVDLDDSVRAFFDDIFPSVYHKMINPRLTDLSPTFVQCLKSSQKQISPFGDVPRKIAEHLAKSFKTAHILLQALNLGIEVINTTDHSAIYEECSFHLTRLVYCPHCQLGVIGAKPCNGYCLNVVRGCLATIAELDQPWNDYVTAMTSMTSQMKGMFSIEEALAMLDERISEGIMHAVDQGPDINTQVEVLCKDERKAQGDDPNSHTAPIGSSDDEMVANIRNRRSLSPNLYTKIESFMKSLSKSKGFYSTLADNICSDDSLSVKSHETNCWNGHKIGEYTKILVGVGMEAQKYNPELRFQRFADLTIARLKDKLIHIRKKLHSQIVTKPESDSFTVNTGSGYYYNTLSLEDDEDYSLFASGSGDIGFSDSYPKETTPTMPEIVDKEKSASSGKVNLSVTFVTLATSIMLLLVFRFN